MVLMNRRNKRSERVSGWTRSPEQEPDRDPERKLAARPVEAGMRPFTAVRLDDPRTWKAWILRFEV
jgi:hypothetical protein